MRSAFIASLHISTLLHQQNCRLHPAWPSQLSIIQFLVPCACTRARLCERLGISNSFNVWLCCIRFMRSTHEQTVRYQNKCSRSGCVSWDVCTEISLMVISLGKHVDILEALSSSVSLLDLFPLKFQYPTVSGGLQCFLRLLYEVHCARGLALVLSAPHNHRCVFTCTA